MITLVNLTPHILRLIIEGEIVDLPPSGEVADYEITYKRVGQVHGISLINASNGPIVGLPDQIDDNFFIVSEKVRLAVPDRLDVLSPGSIARVANVVVINDFILNNI
jgi:hypothetical protein